MKRMWASFLVWAAALVGAEPGATLDARRKPEADNANLPRVMIIGDSISVGYTDGVREELAGKANVYRVQGNAGPSSSGVQQVDKWIASGTGRWDVIHFNFGLHDVKRGTGGKDNRAYPTADGRQVSADDYERNLREIVAKLKHTGATLHLVLNHPHPQGKLDPPRRPGDEVTYNQIAKKVMIENGVVIDDLHAAVLSQKPGIEQPANVHFTKEGCGGAGQTRRGQHQSRLARPRALTVVTAFRIGGRLRGSDFATRLAIRSQSTATISRIRRNCSWSPRSRARSVRTSSRLFLPEAGPQRRLMDAAEGEPCLENRSVGVRLRNSSM